MGAHRHHSVAHDRTARPVLIISSFGKRTLTDGRATNQMHAKPLKSLIALGVAAAPWVMMERASARPSAPQGVCDTWPEAAGCGEDTPPGCGFCHTTPPARNAFGLVLEANLLPGEPRPLSPEAFDGALPDALRAIADGDADEDGATNLEEAIAGTSLADPEDHPGQPTAPTGCDEPNANPDWNVCGFDPSYAYRKLHLDVCGHQPEYEDYAAFKALPREARPAALTEALEACLQTDFWRGRDGVLWRLAHKKIRPLLAIKSGEGAGPVPLADYFQDYKLFVYTQTDDRDARLTLTADFLVEMVGSEPVRFIVDENSQRLTRDRRAGMITTPWFFTINTMFTPLPRTTAAQAYRSYLGLDIAKSQGLYPAPEALVDYDAKGITEPGCAACHTTLDPLSYPFSRYNGITGPLTGTYARTRVSFLATQEGLDEEATALMQSTPEAGYIFGEPVADLIEWAARAAESDDFAKATVMDYWTLMVGHPPEGEAEEAEFESLWRKLRGEHEYQVSRMLQDLIRTEAYGAP